jgi:hypothetical protein
LPLQVALRGRIIAARWRRFSTQVQSTDPAIPERFLCAPTPTTPFAFDSFTVCFVDTIDALAKTKAAVLSSSRVGLDTEFVKGFNYTPSLELVQIATSDSTIHVVDCRAIETLQRGSLVELLTAVVSRPVVLHAADEDLRLMYLWTKKIPTCIFDTQVTIQPIYFSSMVDLVTLVLLFSWLPKPLESVLSMAASLDTVPWSSKCWTSNSTSRRP